MSKAMTTSPASNEQRRDEMHQKFAELGLKGYWQNQRETHRVEPRLWRWEDVHPALLEASQVIRLGDEAFRRNVSLITESRTVVMGFQIVLPGEAAPAHRHTNTALRFVVKGGGAYTTSNGEPMVMEPGDLLIQPNFVWHDHVNKSSEPIIWIDALDVGVVSFLDCYPFRENWPTGEQQPLTLTDGASRRLYGPIRKPVVEYEGAGVPYHYKWGETLEALEELAASGDCDPYDGVLLEYKNPLSGGHTFLTMTCHIQMLLPGQETQSHRHTGTTHYHVVQGEGVTTVGRKEPKDLVWDKNDSFTLPPWRWHRFRNRSKTEPAILFSVTDKPMLEMTGLHREERGA